MTITIECEWDEDDLSAYRIEVEGCHCPISFTDKLVHQAADKFLKEVARWKIQQNRKQTERDE